MYSATRNGFIHISAEKFLSNFDWYACDLRGILKVWNIFFPLDKHYFGQVVVGWYFSLYLESHIIIFAGFLGLKGFEYEFCLKILVAIFILRISAIRQTLLFEKTGVQISWRIRTLICFTERNVSWIYLHYDT